MSIRVVCSACGHEYHPEMGVTRLPCPECAGGEVSEERACVVVAWEDADTVEE